VAVFWRGAWLIAFLGEGSTRSLKLSAFLLLCIGIQILAQARR
jgi:hypothetical protein